MALSAFDDKSHRPALAELAKVLRTSAPHWTALVEFVKRTSPGAAELWNYSGVKFGWSLRLKQKSRVLLYLTPQAGKFFVGVVLGEKAATSAADAGLSSAALALIDGAPRYAEGRGIRMPVATRKDLAVARELAALKIG